MIKYCDLDTEEFDQSEYILLDDTIYDDLDKFIEICHINQLISFMSPDFERVKFINDSLEDLVFNPIILIDDGEMKDRSYIKREDYFKLSRFGVPLSYVMWNPEFDSYLYTLEMVETFNTFLAIMGITALVVFICLFFVGGFHENPRFLV